VKIVRLSTRCKLNIHRMFGRLPLEGCIGDDSRVGEGVGVHSEKGTQGSSPLVYAAAGVRVHCAANGEHANIAWFHIHTQLGLR